MNKNIRFLLTVSPVPLTAIASDEHVLPATIYSKSTLRSVAGWLKNHREDVDYFPSYELISSFSSKGTYFEDNLRSVTEQGVEFVMAHFEKGIQKDKNTKQNEKSKKNKKQTIPSSISHDEDAACEEIFLESWNEQSTINDAPQFLLIGDSHMGKLSLAFQRNQTPHIGGMIMNGSAWFSKLFHIDNEELFVPLENKKNRDVWNKTVHQLNTNAKKGGDKPIIITNIVVQSHKAVNHFATWSQQTSPDNHFDPNHSFTYFSTELVNQCALVRSLVQEGYKVLVISDPPVQKYFKNLETHITYMEYYEKLYEAFVGKLGADFLYATDWISEEFKGNSKFIASTAKIEG